MLFPSLIFLFAFLPIVLGVYYSLILSRKAQNRLLLVASLFFYAWGEPAFVFIMAAMVAVDWALALAMAKTGVRSRRSKTLLAFAVSSNLAVLFVAKYLSLTVGILNSVLPLSINDPALPLPIGVSFFTFQSLSYVIDVYRGEKAQRNILDLGLYISLFPQLVAGPIVRYTTFEPQLVGRKESLPKFSTGVQRFIVGLSKKVLLANTLGLVADHAFDAQGDVTTVLLWMGVVAYTLQIYYDFSGYSDMAIGLGLMFGFEFPENFNYPYVSKSVSEFWRRWHISLGTWFRDYVYFPLGGSRVGSKARLAFNLFVVWALTGIWHGADLTFLAWGLMYFVLLAAEKLIPPYKHFLECSRIASHVITMAFVMAGWVLFRAQSFSGALWYYEGLLGIGQVLCDGPTIVLLRENLIFLVAGIILCTPISKAIGSKLCGSKAVGWIAIVGLLLSLE